MSIRARGLSPLGFPDGWTAPNSNRGDTMSADAIQWLREEAEARGAEASSLRRKLRDLEAENQRLRALLTGRIEGTP